MLYKNLVCEIHLYPGGQIVKRTGILRDRRYLDHFMGHYHPESPQRLEAIYEMLNGPDMMDSFKEIPARKAEREDLLLIHSPDYVNMLEATDGVDSTYLDPDTQTSPGSYKAALLAAGGLCEAISMVNSGEIQNAFALVRPPGHHAEKHRAMGFCLFNNIAIGARYAQKHLGIKRILIADWDLHHGNGTHHSFEDDPSVLYFSTHQYPYYPGTGANGEVGTGKGEGFTINVPLSPGYGDSEYIAIYNSILNPVALEFNPEIILVSAGFDTYKEDPLGGMNITSQGFAGLTRSIMDIADACCAGKVVITLEGGYHIQGQTDSVKAVLMELSGTADTDYNKLLSGADKDLLRNAIGPVKEIHRQYWNNL
jgi:acetoin utilization deacetylase AcuC-like enzyme